MISLYPFHIYISFPYSHILPYPYISHIHVSIFLSAPPVALPLVFFSFFSFCGMKAGCVFLVVFWCRYCGWFSSRFSSRFSFRFSVRSSFRPSFRSSPRFVSRFALRLVSSFRSSVRSPFRPSVRFSVWACRVGGLLVAPFLSARLGRGGRLFLFRALVP